MVNYGHNQTVGFKEMCGQSLPKVYLKLVKSGQT